MTCSKSSLGFTANKVALPIHGIERGMCVELSNKTVMLCKALQARDRSLMYTAMICRQNLILYSSTQYFASEEICTRFAFCVFRYHLEPVNFINILQNFFTDAVHIGFTIAPIQVNQSWRMWVKNRHELIDKPIRQPRQSTNNRVHVLYDIVDPILTRVPGSSIIYCHRWSAMVFLPVSLYHDMFYWSTTRHHGLYFYNWPNSQIP